MLLAVDIGNSQSSFGIFENHKLSYHWRAETKPSRTADEHAAFLLPLLGAAGLTTRGWEGVALCSVVPSAERAFHDFCVRYLDKKPFAINHRIDLGFRLDVDTPSEVGADRLANAAFAVHALKLPAIVVDLGTATTFDVVGKDRAYRGGIILPGVRLSFEALSTKTSKLPLVDVGFPSSVIGRNTAQCIQSGILYGYCDLIDGLLVRLVREVGEPCDVALTGGLSFLFEEHLKHRVCCLPDLTLDGIRILYERRS